MASLDKNTFFDEYSHVVRRQIRLPHRVETREDSRQRMKIRKRLENIETSGHWLDLSLPFTREILNSLKMPET